MALAKTIVGAPQWQRRTLALATMGYALLVMVLLCWFSAQAASDREILPIPDWQSKHHPEK